MAWIFSLSAECGADPAKAQLFARYFDGVTWTLSNDRGCRCRADIFQDMDENWWSRVRPDQLSEMGIESPASAYLMTELGILFYQHLKQAPPFRYALVGVEVDEFRTYRELLSDSSELSIPGLVVATEVERELGGASAWQPFSRGYSWLPYEGEIYNPLMASPSLKNKLDELSLAG